LFAIVFSVGAALTALAGMLAAPINSVYPGMGENILIISFVVVVIGGIGSIKGAFIGSMMIGLADTFGRVMVPEFSSMVVYALMAAVLLWRPSGLYGTKAA
jgi:branched-chain amino acid transport system permease protein